MPQRLYPRVLTARARASKVGRALIKPRLWGAFIPALREGVFPSLEHTTVPFGMEFATVLDVGASRGQFALFARSRFRGAKIVCFEPLPEARATASRVLDDDDITLHGVALGVSSGQTELHVSARDDSSSLLPIGSQQVNMFPGTHETGTITVRVERLEKYLDDTIVRPCLLKLDVQGMELEVLRGAGPKLAHVDEVFVEVSFIELYTGQALAGDVIGYLAEHGLRLVDVHSVVRDSQGAALQADLLFRRVPT